MYQHFIAARRRMASDRLALLQAAFLAFSSDKNARQDAARRAAAIGEIGIHTLSAFEYAGRDDDARIRLIGNRIKVQGQQWLQANTEEAQWLEARGLSGDEALERYEAWHREQMADSFWE